MRFTLIQMKSRLRRNRATSFPKWVDWAKEHQVGLDFNPTFFSHPMMKDGFTLASSDPEVRAFGLNTVNVHVVSQNISVKNLEKLATQTFGFQMDSKITQWIV